ncbi:MAG: FAD-dependent oxidoreductase [Gammaproteobacteria bacterium]|nr:FAD-dependent oxidoreductase [Gammaproteobacteria bacterium]
MTTETVASVSSNLIVVGTGIAGLSAAVTAAQAGARVTILERATEAESGGNSRYTESFWRMRSESEIAPDLEERLAANAGGHPDPGLVREMVRDYEDWPGLARSSNFTDPNLIAAIARDAPVALNWLTSFGIKFDTLPIYFLSQSTNRIAPIGGGLALIEALGAFAETSPLISIHYETTAHSLVLDDAGHVAGINAVGRHNRPVQFDAPNVVLASGGFQGNPEMLSHYIGPQSVYTRPVARGGHYNRGEGIKMALDVGAAPCGDFGSFHAQPVDPRSAEAEAVVLNYAWGILVNETGHRFLDEAAGMTDATYEVVTRDIMRQPHGMAWAVFDAKLDDVTNWSTTVRSREAPLQADSLTELAKLAGLPADAFASTVSQFNDACPSEGTFDPLVLDGLATGPISPSKSNWARALDRPPFRAWPIIAANCFTFGGLKINDHAQVINTAGDAIPGLYAAGETAGIYYRVYPGATSVMRGAVTGRLAGQHAARANQ